MDARSPSERPHDHTTDNDGQMPSLYEKKVGDVVVASSEASTGERDGSDRGSAIPLKMKLIAILLVTATGFGSHWSSGVTGAMKSTVKKV